MTAAAACHHGAGSASIMRSSSHPRGRTGGNNVVRWYSRSSTVGHPRSWPRSIHSSNDRRGSTGTWRSVSSRTSMTPAPSAYRAHAARQLVPLPTGVVRAGSIARQTARRVERHPLGRPSANGEFANAAASTGPRWWAAIHRRSTSSSGPEVDVHLDRGGAAHHRAPRGAVGVEVRLHRVVARRVEHAVALRTRLETEADEADPGAGQRVAEHRGVVDQRLAGREPRERAGAQLDLAAGLERDRAARRQLPHRGRGLAHRRGSAPAGRRRRGRRPATRPRHRDAARGRSRRAALRIRARPRSAGLPRR